MAAVKQWLEQRLRLEVSADKTRVANLKNRYSEFLGIKMRLKQKKDKLLLQSSVCTAVTERYGASEQLRWIRDTPVAPIKVMSKAKLLWAKNGQFKNIRRRAERKSTKILGICMERISKFNPEVYKYQYADELAPKMQLAPMGWRGYIEMRPIREIK